MIHAEDIVRDLAAIEFPVSHDMADDAWCAVCGAHEPVDGDLNDPQNHLGTCVWRRAKEQVEQDRVQTKAILKAWERES